MTLEDTFDTFDKTENDTFISVFDMFSTWLKKEYNYTSRTDIEKTVLDAWLKKPKNYLKYGFITSQKCSVWEYDLLGLLYSVPEKLPFSIKELVLDYLSKSKPLQIMNEEYLQQILDVPKVFLEKNS